MFDKKYLLVYLASSTSAWHSSSASCRYWDLMESSRVLPYGFSCGWVPGSCVGSLLSAEILMASCLKAEAEANSAPLLDHIQSTS